jgi:hypothetical protein
MKICFYTEGHLGDFIQTVPFVKLLSEKYPEHEYYQFVYGSHGTRYPDIFLKTVPGLIPTEELCGDINIPTWFCNPIYDELTRTGPIPYDLFSIQKYFWKNVYKKYNFDVEIPENTGLDFEFENILENQSTNLIRSVFNNSRKKILFINPKGRSGQTDNENWLDKIINLSNLYSEYDFYYTNKEEIEIDSDNIFYTPDVFGTYPSDILHNGYLSTFCDIIVGRNCGALIAISMQNKNILCESKILITQTQDNIHKPDLECFYNSKIYVAKNIHTKQTQETFFELERILCQ